MNEQNNQQIILSIQRLKSVSLISFKKTNNENHVPKKTVWLGKSLLHIIPTQKYRFYLAFLTLPLYQDLTTLMDPTNQTKLSQFWCKKDANPTQIFRELWLSFRTALEKKQKESIAYLQDEKAKIIIRERNPFKNNGNILDLHPFWQFDDNSTILVY
jgi:hypothetical protein